MWFQTQIQTHQLPSQVNQISYTTVLQVWSCKKCLNTIYQQRFLYDIFRRQQKDSKRQLYLQNVNIVLKDSEQQKVLQVGYSGKKFRLKNQAKVYCKYCPTQFLGQFRPNLSKVNVEFYSAFDPNLNNIKVSEIVYGRLTSQTKRQNKLKIFDKNEPYIFQTVLKQFKRYYMQWACTRNIEILKGFPYLSKEKRHQVEVMTKFMQKLKNGKTSKEKKAFNSSKEQFIISKAQQIKQEN